MVDKQLTRTFMAASATAAGVSASSHPAQRNRSQMKNQSWDNTGVTLCCSCENTDYTALLEPNNTCIHCTSSGYVYYVNEQRHTPSVLLATVPLKEREVDFLDSSSTGVSKGRETANWPAGFATYIWKQKIIVSNEMRFKLLTTEIAIYC